MNICFHLVIVVSIDYSYSFCFIMDFLKIFFLFISSLFSGIYTSCLWYLILPFIFAENLFRLMTEFVASFVLCSFSGMSTPVMNLFALSFMTKCFSAFFQWLHFASKASLLIFFMYCLSYRIKLLSRQHIDLLKS